MDKILQLDENLLARRYRLVRLIDVLKFHAHAFVSLMGQLAKVEGLCEGMKPATLEGELTTAKTNVAARLAEVKSLCERVGLKMSALCVDGFRRQ